MWADFRVFIKHGLAEKILNFDIFPDSSDVAEAKAARLKTFMESPAMVSAAQSISAGRNHAAQSLLNWGDMAITNFRQSLAFNKSHV